jgi:hypothetical protein
MSRTTLRAATRRTFIQGLLCRGEPLTVPEILTDWQQRCGRALSSHVFVPVGATTIRRDIAVLLHEKSIEKAGVSPKIGHEYGGGRVIRYEMYVVPLHRRPGYCGICNECHDPRLMWPHH